VSPKHNFRQNKLAQEICEIGFRIFSYPKLLFQKVKQGKMSKPSKKSVLQKKAYLQSQRENYLELQDVLLVFQTYNKAYNAGEILRPFLSSCCRNILVFADGCIDRSSEAWQNLMPGINHYTVSANDVHEISNYRYSLNVAKFLGCRYVVLFQDDDVYDERIIKWIRCAIEVSKDRNAAIVGGNAGIDLADDFVYQKGDASLLSAEFKFEIRDGVQWSILGDFEKMIIVETPRIEGTEFPFRFVGSVNRAPQLIEVNAAEKLGFFPRVMEPFQYDDYYNSFQAWIHGYTVALMPIDKVSTNLGGGGMRLYNDVTKLSRPAHFIDNWNFILQNYQHRFRDIINLVKNANANLTKVLSEQPTE
jgi:hypothetical protein